MTIAFKELIPTLRMFDEQKAREFYPDFLGFEVTFEHRFQEDYPLYLGIAKGAVHIHLSEHYGDGSPGRSLAIETDGVDAYQAELAAKKYGYSRPGEPEETDWGTREMTIGDPFGNRITFSQNLAG